MRRYVIDFAIVFFLTCLILPFNNCGHLNSRSPESYLSGGTDDPKVSVIAESPLIIDKNTQTFRVSGSCTKGKFKNSVIYWSIKTPQDNVIVDSHTLANAQYFTTCEDNNYSVEVKVPCPGITNNNTGCYGLAQSYKLQVRINGVDENNIEHPEAYGVSVPLTLSP